MRKEELVEVTLGKVKDLGKEEKNAKLEGLGKKEIDAILKAYAEVVNEGLVVGDEVPFTGVGKFAIVEKAEREALKNPRKPEEGKKIVPAHNAPKFKFSKSVKDALSKK